VFGNYVIQKLLDYGTVDQKRELAAAVQGHMLELSLHMYGCRVVQKVISEVFVTNLVPQDVQDSMLRELNSAVMRCIQDQNGNHVIQKCIEQIRPTTRIEFIVGSFRGQVCKLATHPYGCRVIQRVLEHCPTEFVSPALEEVLNVVPMLVTDQYGNYVAQHILQYGRRGHYSSQRRRLVEAVLENLVQFSTHKFASNVVEKCLQFGNAHERRELISRMLSVDSEAGAPPLQLMTKDPYANYVVQKVIDIAEPDQLEQVVIMVRLQSAELKRLTYSKHILTRLEKIPINVALLQKVEQQIANQNQQQQDITGA
jgi:pumilio RNA-binding family